MLLEKLPLELVQQIISLAVLESKINGYTRTLTAIVRVNKTLESEVANLCLRNVQEAKYGLSWWPQVPFLVRLRMAREMIATKPIPGEKRTIATYMHAVAYYLRQYALFHDPGETGRLSHMQWLHEVASILALRGADCGCGKPAFMHSRCYDLASVPDTAFHIVVLRQHTKLESSMIFEQRKGIDTVCPYLKVSKDDLLFTRRNALEWACALRLENSVMRLVAAAEAQGKNAATYLPTAAAVCAMHTKSGKETLLKSLLNGLDKIVQNSRSYFQNAELQYCRKLISRKDWMAKVFTSLAQHRRLDGMSAMRKHYPYCESKSMLCILPKQLQWEPIKAFMESERTCCNFRKWDERENYRHWAGCRKDWCRNRYSKAGPWHNACMRHTWMQMTSGNGPKCEDQHPPHDALYDWGGWPKH